MTEYVERNYKEKSPKIGLFRDFKRKVIPKNYIIVLKYVHTMYVLAMVKYNVKNKHQDVNHCA